MSTQLCLFYYVECFSLKNENDDTKPTPKRLFSPTTQQEFECVSLNKILA